MELTSEYFELANELMEYITRGDGTYSVNSSDTKCKIISVKASLVRNDDGSAAFTYVDDEPIQFFADIQFVLNNEIRGVARVCLSPLSIMVINFKSITLTENDSLTERLAEIRDEIEDEGPTMNEENTTVWSKCLVNYISKGVGAHTPNFVDSMLGMTQVIVKWTCDQNKKLINFGDDEVLLYQCQVAYGSQDGASGSVTFQIMPCEIDFL